MNHHASGGQGWKHRAERAEEARRDTDKANVGLRQINDTLRATLAEQQVELDRLGVEVQRLARDLARAREVAAVGRRLAQAMRDMVAVTEQVEDSEP